MKKFLIFVLGLVIGALAVYFLFPYTAKSQKETTGYVEKIDSLVQEGERLAEQLRIAERLRTQTPKATVQSKPAAQQPAAQPKVQTEQPKKTTQPSQGLGKTYFENAVEYTGRKSFQVNKVLENGDAMAREVTTVTSGGSVYTTGGVEVLLECNPESPYYDSQVVKAASGKKIMQLGTYRYKEYSFSDSPKTIPIIAVR